MADETSDEVLLDSMVRVTWDPDGVATVLVAIGDPMWQPVLIDGKQMVDVAQGLNRKGVLNIPRANETHKLTFTLCRETDGPVEAFQERLDQALAAPREMADVQIAFESGAAYRLKNCAVESWPSGQAERLTKETLVILGGELIADGDAVAPIVADLTLLAETDLRNASGAIGPTMEAAATWQSTTGSYQASQSTAGNRPLAIRPTPSNASGVGLGAPVGGLYQPGIAGNYASAPATVGELFVNGDFSLIWDGVLPSYTPTAKTCLLSRWTAAGDQRSYAFFLNTDGTLELQISTDGTAAGVLTYTSTVPTALPNHRFVGLGVIRTGSNITFWLLSEGFTGFEDSEIPALKLGATVSAVSTDPHAGTAPLTIGCTDAGASNLMTGWTRTALVYEGIFTIAVNITTGYLVKFNSVATGTTSVPTAFGGGQPNMTVNRTGVLPARIIKGYRATFDGTNDSMDLGAPLSANAIGGLSLVWRGILNRVSGLNDLILIGTADGTQPRALLRVDGGDLKVLVRRLDAESTATITYAAAMTQYAAKTLGVTVDYSTGLAALYVDGALVTTGALTSSGISQAANSGATRIMAGIAAANPAAGDLFRVTAYQRAVDIFEMASIHAAFLAAETSNG